MKVWSPRGRASDGREAAEPLAARTAAATAAAETPIRSREGRRWRASPPAALRPVMALLSALCAFLWNRFTRSSQLPLFALVAPDGAPNGLAEAAGMDGMVS